MQILPLILFLSPFLLIALFAFAKVLKEARFMALLERSGRATKGTVIGVRQGAIRGYLGPGRTVFFATVRYEDQGKVYLHEQQTSQALYERQSVPVNYLPQNPARARLMAYSVQGQTIRGGGCLLLIVLFFVLAYWFNVR